MQRRMLTLAGLAVVTFSLAWALSPAPALVSSAEAAQPKRGVEVIKEFRVPTIAYSAFVIAAYGGGAQAPSYAAVITDGKNEFPVTVRGGETLVIPFTGGWTPTDCVIKINPDAPTYSVMAWGIAQAGGPVAFEKIGTK